MKLKKYPEPTVDEPSAEMLEYMAKYGEDQATDGCAIEDGDACEHGYPSWFVYLRI